MINNKQSEIAVATVTYNSLNNIKDFLTSFRREIGEYYPIYVADNGSTDGTVEFLEAEPQVVLVKMPGNLGYGTAINRVVAGLTEKPEHILVANPDLIWTKTSITELLKASQKQTKAGILGPAIYDLSGELYPSARIMPSLFAGTGHAILSGVWPNNPWSKKYRNYVSLDHEGIVDWVSGACMLIKYSAWEQVKGFDEGYFMYLEDVDLAARMKEKGWYCVFVPTAKVEHDQGHSAKKYKKITLTAHHDSMKRFLNRKYDKKWQYPVRLLTSLGLEVRKRYLLRKIVEQ